MFSDYALIGHCMTFVPHTRTTRGSVTPLCNFLIADRSARPSAYPLNRKKERLVDSIHRSH